MSYDMRVPGSSAIIRGGVDCDLHVEVPSLDALLPYLEPHWRDHLRQLAIGVRIFVIKRP